MKTESSLRKDLKKIELSIKANFELLKVMVESPELKDLSIKDPIGGWIENAPMFLYRITKEEEYIVKNLRRLADSIPKPKRKKKAGRF